MTRRQPPGTPSGGEFGGKPLVESNGLLQQPEFDRTEQTLSDLIEFVEQAERLVARGRANFDDDEFQQLASEAILHRIGEAVARLDKHAPEVVAAHPEVNWRPMKAMRNVVAHEYGAIDYDIVWNALADHLPREAEAIQRVLHERIHDS